MKSCVGEVPNAKMSSADQAKNMLQRTLRPKCRLSKRDTLLLFLEAIVCYAPLVLFILAYPDRFRTKLWENGGARGWNSDPKLRIYFYANHKEPPEVPLIWTQRYIISHELRSLRCLLIPMSFRLTDSNLAIAILSAAVHASRAVLRRLGFLPLWTGLMWDICLVGFWSLSIIGQASGDYSDPDHISHHPWYLTRSCTESWASTTGYCQVAQASFAMTILAAMFYLCRASLDIWDAITDRRNRDIDRESARWQCSNAQEKPFDVESVIELEYEDKLGMNTEALSPVLAFYPESGRAGRWS